MEITARFDMRGPSFGPPTPRLYAAALEMVAYADQHGVDTIMLSEHHGAEDGYCPSPAVLAGAVGARTNRARIRIGSVILPLHDPVALAEQILVADQISGGRIEVVAALGYVASEFTLFGKSMGDRPRLMEHNLRILGEALTGEPFGEHGLRLTPAPVQRPRPPLLGAGAVRASALRAARYCDGFYPMSSDPELRELYRATCRDLGRPAGPIVDTMGPMFVHVTDDPDKAWAQIGPHALHEMNSYGKWAADSVGGDLRHPYRSVEDVAAARASGMYAVVTPDQCLDLMAGLDTEGHSLVLTPMLGGFDPDLAWPALTAFFEDVLPRYRTRTGRDRPE